MSATVSLTQTQIFIALVAVLSSFGLVSGAGVAIPIVRGQVNRVPEPKGADFVVMWPLARDRLTMNVDTWQDTIITGSIASNVLTVTNVTHGPILIGQGLYGTNIATGCRILAQLSGTAGGNGTYTVSATPNHSSELMYCGTGAAMQETDVMMQIDVHGPASADNVARISTLWRDQFAVSAFVGLGLTLSPLYASDPRQIPFEDGEQQTEERWTIDLSMQANVTITTTQQFADELIATLTPVETLAIM